MLSHILYGTASLTHGGLTITAICAGKRGEAASLQVTLDDTPGTVTTPSGLAQYDGESILVSVVNPGTVAVFAPSNTTEAALLTALNALSAFKQYAVATQSSGDGTATISALTKTNLTAAGGIRQSLESKLGILGWNDRDLITTGAATGLLWPAQARITRQTVDPNGVDFWTGAIQAAVAFQHNSDFETQNSLLDAFRAAVYFTTKEFTHPDLEEIGAAKFVYGNITKDEVAGTVIKDARMRIIGTFPLRWTEPAYDPYNSSLSDGDWPPLMQFQTGLFNNPVEESPGASDSILDTQLIVTP